MNNLFDGIIEDLLKQAASICKQMQSLPLEDQVRALNQVRQALHQVSPFKEHPVDCVLWVPGEEVTPNDYNPNAVAPPEMRLLALSIDQDGYTQPVVVYDEGSQKTVIDGAHRSRVGKEQSKIRRKVHGYLPVTVINSGRADIKDRIAATIRHNRARGVHGVTPMSEIVANLFRLGWTDDEVARELGMDADEVLRFKQNVGLPELFKDYDYSMAWE